MKWKKVTAIIHTERLETVERKLQEIGVPGLTVTQVKGFGEYANFFRGDWMVRHVRLEIFTHEERAREILRAIMEAAHTGTSGDGIVAVHPVEELYRIQKELWQTETRFESGRARACSGITSSGLAAGILGSS